MPLRDRVTERLPGRALLVDAVVGVGLALLAFAPSLAANGVVLGDLPPRPLDALGIVLLLAQVLPLAGRRVWPAACLLVVGTAFCAYQVLAYPSTVAGLGLFVALYSAGAHLRRRWGLAAALALLVYAGLAVALTRLGSPEPPDQLAVFALVLSAPWVLGRVVQAQVDRAAEHRRQAARLAALEERARIARELHDVVSHHVTAMVVQADTAQFLPPDRARGSAEVIAETGRRALGDLRELLGVLHDGDPPARPDALHDVVRRTGAAGQPVRLTERGTPRELADDAGLALVRVVQEALTNALKHAPGRDTAVEVDYADDAVAVAVSTPAGEGSAPVVPGGGRGLAGLRRRVEGVGGELTAGPDPDGRFVVRARVPGVAR